MVIKHAKYKGMPHKPVMAVITEEVLACNMLLVAPARPARPARPAQPAQSRPSGREFYENTLSHQRVVMFAVLLEVFMYSQVEKHVYPC